MWLDEVNLASVCFSPLRGMATCLFVMDYDGINQAFVTIALRYGWRPYKLESCSLIQWHRSIGARHRSIRATARNLSARTPFYHPTRFIVPPPTSRHDARPRLARCLLFPDSRPATVNPHGVTFARIYPNASPLDVTHSPPNDSASAINLCDYWAKIVV